MSPADRTSATRINQADPAVAPSTAGAFGSVAPRRLLDTRSGIGAVKGPIGKLSSVAVAVTGVAGVPAAGVSAVVVNVTVIQPSASGYLTAYADGAVRPTASNLNFVVNQTVPNLVVVPVGADGKIRLFNGSTGTAHMLLDIAGYYLSGTPSAAGAFGSVAPRRLLDTRSGVGAVKGPIGKLSSVAVAVTGVAGVPAAGVSAVVVNVTVIQPSASGYLTAYADGAVRPTASNLNFVVNQTVPNLVVVPVGADGKIRLFNGSTGTAHMLLDIAGYYLSGTPSAAGAFGSVAPRRLLDTRSGIGAVKGPIGKLSSVAVAVTGVAGVPAAGVSAVVVNVTVIQPSASGYLTAYADGAVRPTASNLNFVVNQTVPNLVVVPVGADGKIRLFNGSTGTAHMLLDIAGYYLSADRTVSMIKPKATTNQPASDQIQSVTGEPSSNQTTILTAGTHVPAKGEVVASPASAGAPSGLLGTVADTTQNSDGTTSVNTTPATLDQAYSTFDVATSIDLSDEDVEPATVTSSGGLRPTRSGTKFSLKNVAFDCQGSGAGPTIVLDADLSKIHLDFALDIYGPSMHFLLTAYPTFDLNIGFTAQVTCTLSPKEGNVLVAHIPIAGTPPLDLVLKPVMTLTAGGQVSIDFNWSPRAVIGFDQAPGLHSTAYGFGSSASVGFSGTAGADLFLGLSAEVQLAGRIGIGGDFGPDLQAKWDAVKSCFTVEALLKADLTASADIFVKHWTFALASGEFNRRELYKKCGDSGTDVPVITTTLLPQGTVGIAYATDLTTQDHRAGSWTVTIGTLPPGLHLSNNTISGVPTDAGSSSFIVKFTDGHGLSATANVTLEIKPPASSYAGSGGGDGWGVALTSSKVFNVFHHSSSLTIACHNQSDSTSCWDPVTVQDSDGNDFSTSGQPGLWIDQTSQRVYVFATRSSDLTGGVVCIDTLAVDGLGQRFCGFTPLTAVGAASLGQQGISGISAPAITGNRMYAFNFVSDAPFLGTQNSLMCFDLQTLAACSGFISPSFADATSTFTGSTYPEPAVTTIAGRIIVPLSVDGVDQLACFDAATLNLCAGHWPITLNISYASNFGAAFPMLDSNGAAVGLCLPTGTDPCFSFAGDAIDTPAGMSDAISGTSGWNGAAVVLNNRVYVADGNSDSVRCYDFGHMSQCDGYPQYLSNLQLLYTVSADPYRPACLWVNSDNGAGQIQNFDANTGGVCASSA